VNGIRRTERLKRREDEEEDVSSYWIALTKWQDTAILKAEALDRSLWRTDFGRGYEPVVTDYVN
jgi:hypothetical protein